MSYPQPESTTYAVNGYPFFRLNTLLTSPGDIYESEQGALAFVLGPDSDVARVQINYFDNQVETFVNQTVITTDRSLVGQIAARMSDTYAPAGRPGRILLSPVDLYDPNYRPTGILPNVDTLQFITPVLDVIQYFSTPPTLVPKRNDRVYRFQEIELPSGASYIVVPYWGRKFGSVRVTNLTTGDLTWTLLGVDYYMNTTHAGLETTIDTGTLATGTQRLSLVKAETNGMFDALVIKVHAVSPDGPTPIQITLSDTP